MPVDKVSYRLLVLGVLILALSGYVGYVLYPRFGLPAVQGFSLLLLAMGAGIASFFSPRSFPLLVTLLTRETGAGGGSLQTCRPLRNALTFASALSLGAAIFLLLSGLVLILGGEALFAGVTFTSAAGQVIRILAGVLLLGLDLMQIEVLPFSLHALAAQKIIPGLPMPWIETIAGLVQPEKRINAVMRAYWKAFDPTRLTWSPGMTDAPVSTHPFAAQATSVDSQAGDHQRPAR